MDYKHVGLSGLLAVALFLSACSDPLTVADENAGSVQTSTGAPSASKIRHEQFFDRAVRSSAGKAGGEDSVGVVIEANRVVERYKIVERYGIVERYSYDNVFYGLSGYVPASQLDAILAEMNRDPDITWVEPDFSLPPPEVQLEILQTIQLIPWNVAAVGGMNSATESGDTKGSVNGVNLYVLDTGVRDYDLRLKAMDNLSTSPAGTDKLGHGFSVAATAAAKDNAFGIVGIAPGARVHSMKVLNDDGTADIGTIVEAVDQVISLQQNTDIPAVINLSLGADVGTTVYTALDHAVDAATDAGVVVVVAAGNQGIDASTVTPAHAEGAITVGAYDQLGIFASFSNHGETLDILAPGVDVFTLGISAQGNVVGTLMSGTSLATPHVSGAAALYLAYHPDASPAEVRSALLDAARTQSLAVPEHTTSRTLWVGENFPLSSSSLFSRLFGH